MDDKTRVLLDSLFEIGVTRVIIEECSGRYKADTHAGTGRDWQCTLSSDGPGLRTTVALGVTPTSALLTASLRYKRLHIDPATISGGKGKHYDE